MNPRSTHFCARCGRDVIALVPTWRARGACVLAAVFFLLLTFAVGASGLLLLGGGIVVFVMGAMLVGPLYAEATEPPRCPHCRCVVERLTPGARPREAA